MEASSAERRTRVLIVDDQHVVVEGLRRIITDTDDLTVVAETGSTTEAWSLIERLEPDIVLIDICLEDRAGLEVCRRVRAGHAAVSCIALTTSFDDDLLHDAIDAGVAGYLLTRARCTDVVDAIRHVASGGAVLDPAVTRRLLDMVRDSPSAPAPVDQLTPRRRRLLKLIAEGYTTEAIAEAEFLSEKTVRNQLSLLVRDLGLDGREELTALAKQLHRPTLRWSSLL